MHLYKSVYESKFIIKRDFLPLEILQKDNIKLIHFVVYLCLNVPLNTSISVISEYKLFSRLTNVLRELRSGWR